MNITYSTLRNIIFTIASSVLLSSCTLDREGVGRALYRLDHFYTTSSAEAETAVQQHGYQLDGVPIAGYVFPEPSSFGSIRTVPLYRLYNPGLDDHFYTIDVQERNSAMGNGYVNDGVPIAGYIFDAQVPGTTPFYRVWKSFNPVGSNHFYTTDATERDRAVNVHEYTDEGSEGFIYPSTNTSVPGTVPLYRVYKQERLH